MNNLLYNKAFLQKLLIGFFALLIIIIIVLIYVAFQQDRTSDLDFDSVTINADAVPLTVPDYSEWMCNGFDVELPEGSTYSQLKEQLQITLNNWRTRRPPQELLAHYLNEKNRLIEVVNIFEGKDYREQEDKIIVDGTEYALTVATWWRIIDDKYAATRNTIAKEIPEEIRKDLADLGCYIF